MTTGSDRSGTGRRLSDGATDFIDDSRLASILEENSTVDTARFRDVIGKSLERQPLTPEESAVLIGAAEPEQVEELFTAARRLKQDVYGNRIVIFAPLYIGNECVNNCHYCGFRQDNREMHRRTLQPDEITSQVFNLINTGHKRLIIVFGEHPSYSAEFIAETVRSIYGISTDEGSIRRVNINAAPLPVEDFRLVKEAGIGTYQIFQETYHHDTYARVHPEGTLKHDYQYRLDGLSRAFEGGCDDVGIGALFGLHDWRFEILGLVSHALYLQDRYGVGPHTISIPRLRSASGVTMDDEWIVSDSDFRRVAAIIRLSVPYTGMILTAREPEEVRRDVLSFGISQIDAGSRLEIGGYQELGDAQQILQKEQFRLGDMRSLDQVIRQLLESDQIPSFCTACYRIGRTGEAFMEYAVPGFIQRFCTPNAILTLVEYLTDYASEETKKIGYERLPGFLDQVEPDILPSVTERILLIRESSERDLYF
ncbi:[FeFe] hydrogenase H-cluster radical SAM maturase HydG [Gemmatimonadota bacterium]